MHKHVHFAVLLLVAAIARGDEKIDQYGKDCQTDTGVTDENVQNLQRDIYEDDPKVRNMVFCFHKKIGTVNEDGEIQIEIIEEKQAGIGKENLEKILTKCKDIKGNAPKDTPYEFFKCFSDAKRELNL